jgi:phosphopantothenoylcysteine decarboxylase / phosphopantothenate---cysteine ligase
VVGFAAESEDLHGNARRKLEEKGLDLVCANDISSDGLGFDSDRNALSLLWADGAREDLGPDSKASLAKALWDRLAPRLP